VNNNRVQAIIFKVCYRYHPQRWFQ